MELRLWIHVEIVGLVVCRPHHVVWRLHVAAMAPRLHSHLVVLNLLCLPTLSRLSQPDRNQLVNIKRLPRREHHGLPQPKTLQPAQPRAMQRISEDTLQPCHRHLHSAWLPHECLQQPQHAQCHTRRQQPQPLQEQRMRNVEPCIQASEDLTLQSEGLPMQQGLHTQHQRRNGHAWAELRAGPHQQMFHEQ